LNLLQDDNRFLSYQHHPNNPNTLSNNKIYKIVFDKEGMLWVGTDDGANVLIHTKKAFRIANSTAKTKTTEAILLGIRFERFISTIMGFTG
jgi:ligand-binding sensor domain-containing protein